ncbi:MAG: lysophospholipid acyltransferase family protein, partial [Chloroflexota bacterium]
MAYKIIRFFIRLILRLIARVELTGWENLPAAKGYVIASNHIGRLDAALVYYALDRPDIIMLIAEKYRKNAFWRWLAKQVDGIFIDRFNPDIRALREAMKRLQRGGVLAIAPEGTRSKTGTLIEAKPGGIYLAWKAGVPILPVALTGTQDVVVKERLTHLKRLQIKVTMGPAFTLPQEAKGKDREALLQEYTDEVMCRIA